MWFIDDLASRLANRVQLTSDGHKAYLEAVEGAFGCDVDYAILNKIYGTVQEAAKGRYSPAVCLGAKKERIEGKPDPAHVSTSYVERKQPHDADANAPLYATHKRLLKEGRKPRLRRRASHDVLQFRPHSFEAAGLTRDGGRGCRAPMGGC